jgi:hypothetical protein
VFFAFWNRSTSLIDIGGTTPGGSDSAEAVPTKRSARSAQVSAMAGLSVLQKDFLDRLALQAQTCGLKEKRRWRMRPLPAWRKSG